MASEEVSVIALVENLELAVPRRLPTKFLHQPKMQIQPTRIIELNDQDSKMTLKRQLNFDLDDADKLANKNNVVIGSEVEEQESLEILRRLPAGTILIKQVETNKSLSSKEEEEKKKEPEEIDKEKEKTRNEEEKSSEKPRKFSQRIRNKNSPSRRTLQVRRNPLRIAARKELKDSSHTISTSRQRLLAAKRRVNNSTNNVNKSSLTSDETSLNRSSNNSTTSKRSSRSIPYMNTRSVTKKMYNVGATYEPPTKLDETQWKEWPVHGMHERPVYHPQFGLAVEYNGRLFASFDGEDYRELNRTEAPIEIVCVDPRVDVDYSLEESRRIDHPLSNFAAQYLSQQTIAALSQKLVPAQTTKSANLSFSCLKNDISRIPKFSTFATRTMAFQHFQTQQQLEHIRNFERLQYLENIQRLGSRVHDHINDANNIPASKYISANRLIPKEICRTMENPTVAHAQQQTNYSSQQNPSKCLLMPRNANNPITLPFCGVQAFKSNSKGKLVFVRASDAAKKASAPEITSTITSATQISSMSWSEMNLRKKLCAKQSNTLLPSIDFNSRVHAIEKSQQISNRGLPPVRLIESSSMFRPSLKKIATMPRDEPALANDKSYRDHFRFRDSANNLRIDDHFSEVLDLSKKETSKLQTMEIDEPINQGIEERKASQTYATDLVHYFQNFSADESIDLLEDPKNLT